MTSPKYDGHPIESLTELVDRKFADSCRDCGSALSEDDLCPKCDPCCAKCGQPWDGHGKMRCEEDPARFCQQEAVAEGLR